MEGAHVIRLLIIIGFPQLFEQFNYKSLPSFLVGSQRNFAELTERNSLSESNPSFS